MASSSFLIPLSSRSVCCFRCVFLYYDDVVTHAGCSQCVARVSSGICDCVCVCVYVCMSTLRGRHKVHGNRLAFIDPELKRSKFNAALVGMRVNEVFCFWLHMLQRTPAYCYMTKCDAQLRLVSFGLSELTVYIGHAHTSRANYRLILNSPPSR